MNAKVTYRLSQAGQKAALLVGRTATSQVSETMEFADVSLIDKLRICPDGTMEYARAGYGFPDLDAPPVDLSDLINAIEMWSAAKIAAESERQRLADEATKTKAEADYPVVDALLASFEALPLDAKDEQPRHGYSIAKGYSQPYTVAPEQRARFQARQKAREEFEAQAKAAAEQAKADTRAAMIAEHGGIVFPVEAGMCSFIGQGLWNSGQSKRWVGIFSAMKGIDNFCDSPRGEHSFGVSALHRGHCIQGAGYDTNSRGKRRSETEWFGVVVRCDENEIVVDLHDSRAATIKAAMKITKGATVA